MTLSVYVYYRVPVLHATALKEAVGALQKGLTGRLGVPAALKRRPEAQDGKHTWMEVYDAVPDGFEAELRGAVDAAGIRQWIDGDRHAEYFQDV